jgi:hypothetical protein
MLSKKIAFRIVLYVTTAYTLALEHHFFEALTSQGGGIFVFILWPFIIPPLSITPWYLIGFQKTRFDHLSLLPPLTAISCWFLIKDRFVKQIQNRVASVDNDLWKLDHTIALLWTGIMGVLSLVVIYLVIGNLAMIIWRWGIL